MDDEVVMPEYSSTVTGKYTSLISDFALISLSWIVEKP